MKLMTGFSKETRNSLPTRPSCRIANCSRPDVSSSKRLRRKDGLTSPPLQQQQHPHCPYIKMLSLPTLDVPNVATPTPGTIAQHMVESATIAVACTTTQPCAEDPGDLITQSMTLQPDLPRMPEPDHPKAAGPSPWPILTNKLDPAAGTGRATAQQRQALPL